MFLEETWSYMDNGKDVVRWDKVRNYPCIVKYFNFSGFFLIFPVIENESKNIP